MQSSRRAIFSFLLIFFWHIATASYKVVVSIFGPFFRAGEKTYFLISFPSFLCPKMFVHPDGASTTVPVTLQAKNVKHGPTQV